MPGRGYRMTLFWSFPKLHPHTALPGDTVLPGDTAPLRSVLSLAGFVSRRGLEPVE